MATQFHVAFSSLIMGVGTVAGSPYYCAKGNVINALNACMALPYQVNVQSLITSTNNFAAQSLIDHTDNMKRDKVFVLHGASDTTVRPGESDHIIEYYTHYVNTGNIKTKLDLAMGHAHPTTDYGSACSATRSPYINDCDYNGSFEILNWIYGGNLQRPPTGFPQSGDFYQFDQKEFFSVSGPSAASMDTIGFVYVPSRCIDSQKACKLHIAFHGCVQGRHAVQDVYAKNAGYNEVAELNDIIILYPQAVPTLSTNPNGCWDWWAYDDTNYANKNGAQMKASMAMMTRITGPRPTKKCD